MSILVQEPTRNEDQMIIYPQKPTILAQKRSFTPNFFEFQHFFVHKPLKTSSACIEKSISPLKRLILGIFSLQPVWNHCFARNDGFKVTGLLHFVRNDRIEVSGLLHFVRNDGGWSRWIATLCSQWRVWSHWIAMFRSQWRGWSHWIASLRPQWQRKGIRFLFFIRGKLLKITSIVNFQLISSNP